MGFFLSDWVNSALTPSGTNAKRSQESQQKDVANGAADALGNLKGTLTDESNFAAAQEPARQGAIKRLLMLSSPGNNAARAQIYKNQAYGNAAQSAQLSSAANHNAGISDAYSAGQNQAIANNAADASNTYQANLSSPDAMSKQAQSLLAQYQQAMGMPALTDYNSLANLVYGRPQVMVQPGLGSLVGQVAGDYLSGQLGGAKGAASQSSMTPEYPGGDGYMYPANNPFTSGPDYTGGY
jgi:hypothetical protein